MSDFNGKIKDVFDQERGCGWRKEGGLYLMAGGEAMECLRLPLPLAVCPVCKSGIKPARGWTWVNPREFVARSLNVEQLKSCHRSCFGCPLGGEIDRAGLLWIGEKFYPTTADFMREGAAQGISRRITAIPKDFVVGVDWVLCAHRKAITAPCEGKMHDEECECEGEGKIYTPAVFTAFRPTRIEYVVTGKESEEEIDRMIERGITPVRVVKKRPLFDESNPFGIAPLTADDLRPPTIKDTLDGVELVETMIGDPALSKQIHDSVQVIEEEEYQLRERAKTIGDMALDLTNDSLTREGATQSAYDRLKKPEYAELSDEEIAVNIAKHYKMKPLIAAENIEAGQFVGLNKNGKVQGIMIDGTGKPIAPVEMNDEGTFDVMKSDTPFTDNLRKMLEKETLSIEKPSAELKTAIRAWDFGNPGGDVTVKVEIENLGNGMQVVRRVLPEQTDRMKRLEEAQKLVGTSVQDMTSSLPHHTDIRVLRLALGIVEGRGEKTKSKILKREIEKLKTQSEAEKVIAHILGVDRIKQSDTWKRFKKTGMSANQFDSAICRMIEKEWLEHDDEFWSLTKKGKAEGLSDE